MANTTDSDIIFDIIIAEAKVALANRRVTPDIFATNYNAQGTGSTKVKVVTGGGGMTKGAQASYGGGTTTTTLIDCPVAIMSGGAERTLEDQLNGIQLEDNVAAELDTYLDGIFADATALMTKANFGTESVVATAGAIDGADITGCLDDVKSSSNFAVLKNAYYNALIPTNADGLALSPGTYGIDRGFHKVDTITGTTEGFVGSSDAIVAAFGQVNLPSEANAMSTTLYWGGVPITVNVTFDQNALASKVTFLTMGGFKTGLADAGTVIVNTATA